MNLRLYEPSALLGQLHQDLGRIFDTPWAGLSELASAETSWSPPVDIREDQDHYYLKADVPGVDPKDIEITLERGVLTIAGARQSESKEAHDGYRRVERFRGRFVRAFSLPDTADGDKVDAKVKDGVLEVTINKKESSKPRRISVRA
jgi:HSP20 family protein